MNDFLCGLIFEMNEFSTSKPAQPTKDLVVEPKLFMEIKSADRVPSIPGGQSRPDKIRNVINLQVNSYKEKALDICAGSLKLPLKYGTQIHQFMQPFSWPASEIYKST